MNRGEVGDEGEKSLEDLELYDMSTPCVMQYRWLAQAYYSRVRRSLGPSLCEGVTGLSESAILLGVHPSKPKKAPNALFIAN